jgi:Sulfatase-modifying factor enzyme 1
MHFWKIRKRSLGRSATATISKGAQLALLLCGLVGITSVLLVSSGTMASPNATASNPDERSGGHPNRKALPGMAWIPGGAFLMGTNDKESFPNERPAHLVQVQGFWMDEHDVISAEFSKFVEATGYVTTAERLIDWEELKKQVPPGTPKPDDSALAPGALVFTPTAGPVPLNDLSVWWILLSEKSMGGQMQNVGRMDLKQRLFCRRFPGEVGRRPTPARERFCEFITFLLCAI